MWVRGARRCAALALVFFVGCTQSATPPNPVQGLIVEIDDDRMTVTTEGGRSYEFTIADPSVPVAHLRVHQRTRLPVRITWRSSDGRRRATTIADAPAP